MRGENPFNFDPVDGCNAAGAYEEKIETIYCPAIGSETSNSTIPLSSCLRKQQDPSLPTCYQGCYAKRKPPKFKSPKGNGNSIGKGKKTTEEERMICKMFLAGMSQKDTARVLGRGSSYVCNRLKRLRKRGVLPKKGKANEAL